MNIFYGLDSIDMMNEVRFLKKSFDISGEPVNSILLESEIRINAYMILSISRITIKIVNKNKIVMVLYVVLFNTQKHIIKTNFIIV